MRRKPKIGDLVKIPHDADLEGYIDDFYHGLLSLVIGSAGIWYDIQFANETGYIYRVPRDILEVVNEGR